MKFEISVKSLREALNKLVPFSRSASARIVAADSTVTVSCFSRQYGIFAKTAISGAVVDQSGSVCVEFNRLILASKLAKSTLFAKSNSNAMSLRSGEMSLNINLAEEVPEPPLPDCALRYHVDARAFASAVKPLAALSSSQKMNRIAVTSGVYLEEHNKGLQLVATNGFALYLTEINSTIYPDGAQFTEEESTIVPPHLISAILSALQLDEELAIGRTESAFIIGQPGLVAFGTLQEGKYPPWRRITDDNSVPQVDCSFSELKTLIDSARMFHGSQYGAIRLEVSGDTLTISTQNETSSYKDSMKCNPRVENFAAFCYFDCSYGRWFDLDVEEPSEATIKITFTEETHNGDTAKKLRFDVDNNTEVIMALSGPKYEK